MQKSDFGRLIAHIDEAKSWLDKAREEYVESNPLRGDLHLNLAQAEVKYAWELSRGRNVLKIDAKRRRDGRSYLMPAAALFIVTALGAVLSMYVIKNDKVGKNTVANQPVREEIPVSVHSQTPAKTNQAKPATEVVSVSNESLSGEIETSVQVKRRDIPADSKPSSVVRTKERITSVKNVPAVVPVSNRQTEKDGAIASNSGGDVRSREYLNPIKPQPVSTMAIDEEDLTREASTSLRLGK